MTDQPTVEFSRPLTVDRLREEDGAALTIEATEAERTALAKRFAVLGVVALRAEVAVAPWATGGWRIDGTVEATLEQTCVVSLEPVRQTVSERFTRYCAPSARMAEAEALLKADARDDLESLGPEIDVGEMAAEAAALGIDPYPRRDDAAFDPRVHGPPDAEPLTDEAARPFAGLAALRGRGERE
jgi:uncharacterized metal-binding protein YceD (DUF177 family)